jgi:hypothetical protein
VGDFRACVTRADYAQLTVLARLPLRHVPASMSSSYSITARASVSEAVAHRERRLLELTATLALALACAWPLAFNLADPDLWGHVRYGQDWIAAGELPRTATHTYTAVGYPWINHENLFELAIAACYNTLGVGGMLLAKCLLGMTIVATMVWIAGKHGVHPLVAWVLMLVVTTNLQPFFPLRPQLFSFACCAAVLLLLDRGFRDWHEQWIFDARCLWGLPLVLAVWTNSHGGFVAGLCIVGAYLAGRIAELLLQRKKIAWSKVGQLTFIGLACIAATFVNPYGWLLHYWLAVSLIEPRPEITEWLAPHPGDPVFWPWLAMLAVIGVSLLATAKCRDWVEIVILLLVVWQSAMHLRHIAFVALLCGFWAPVHFQSTLQRLLPTNGRMSFDFSPAVRRIAVVALLVAVATQSFALDRRLKDFSIDRGQFPVDALQFMADRNLEGKAVLAFNWSQYAIAALAPRITVGFDGRYDTCYPLEVVDMHFDFLLGEAGGMRNRSPESGPVDGTKVLEHESPDLVLIDRHYENAVGIMQAEAEKQDPEWVLLYRDRVAELWGRSSKYAVPASPAFIPRPLRVQDASLREGQVPWPAFPVRSSAG